LAAFRILTLLAIIVCPAVVYSAEPSAKDLYKQARKAEKQKNFAQAYLLYSQAAAKNPSKREYWIRAEALRTRAATAANVMPVMSGAPTLVESDVPNLPEPTPKEIAEARRPQPPFELKAEPLRRDFDIRADARALFEQVTKPYGLQVVFDGDYPASGAPIRFRISEADYREALYSLMTVTSSFLVPIGDRVVMVVKDTEQKRREVENHIAVSIPIPGPVTIQEAQELGRSVQQLMEIQRFSIDSSQRLVIFRDRASKVRPAQMILEQMFTLRPQITLEVELIAVGKSMSRGLGFSLPTQFALVPFADIGRLTRTIPSGFMNFLTFGGGSTFLGIGITSAQLLATWSRSVGKTVLKAEMRTVDGQAASFHAGDKYPIMTMGYFGNVQPGEEVFRPPPTFNFEDLGLVLKITPKVHDTHEVTLDVEAEFKLLGTTSFNGIPVINQRKFINRVRLGFDQSAIVAGLVSDTESIERSGLARVLDVPALGSIFGRTTKTRDESEIIVVIKPRLLSLPPSEMLTKEIFIGAESRLLTPI
jgi:general secretion pathway protein D